MSTNITLNNVAYVIPAVGDSGWGSSLSAYLVALSTGVLTKAGGSFALTANADFGANFGLSAISFAGRSTPATTGVFRLGNTQAVAWRNAANSADLALLVNSSNILEFNGSPLVALSLGAANTVLKMNSGATAYEYGLVANANIDNAAAIAHSKLASITAGSLLMGNASNVPTATAITGDIQFFSNGATAIALGAIVNADVNASAGIEYSKLTLTGSIVNADVNASAAIARSKLAAGTASHVIINDGSGNFTSEATLAKSRGGTGANNSSVTFPTSGTIVTRTATETLTNKTIAIPTLTTGADLEDLGSAPTNPTTGYARLYVESGTLKTRDSSGTVTSFGAGLASLNGLVGSTQTFAVGTSGTDFAISSSGTAHTFNIPDAGASARGLVSTGTQTLAGAKSFSSLLTASAGLDVTGGTLDVDNGADSRYRLYNSTVLVGQLQATSSEFRVQAIGAGVPMALYTAGSEKMRITDTGNVGIGTVSPGNLVEIASATSHQLELSSTQNGSYVKLYWDVLNTGGASADWSVGPNNNVFTIRGESTGNDVITATQAGAVTLGPASGTGTGLHQIQGENNSTNGILQVFNRNAVDANPAMRIDVGSNTNSVANKVINFTRNLGGALAGSIALDGGSGVQFSTYSDARLKTNFRPAPPQLDKLLQLNIELFDLINGDATDILGATAQNMQSTFPTHVAVDESTDEKYLQVGGWGITEYRLAKAIQEQQAIIESLKSRIESLEGSI